MINTIQYAIFNNILYGPYILKFLFLTSIKVPLKLKSVLKLRNKY